MNKLDNEYEGIEKKIRDNPVAQEQKITFYPATIKEALE